MERSQNDVVAVFLSQEQIEVMRVKDMDPIYERFIKFYSAKDFEESPLSNRFLDYITSKTMGAEATAVSSETREQAALRVWTALCSTITEYEYVVEEHESAGLPTLPDVVRIHPDYDWLRLEFYRDDHYYQKHRKTGHSFITCLIDNEVEVQTFASLVKRLAPYYEDVPLVTKHFIYTMHDVAKRFVDEGLILFLSFEEAKRQGLKLSPYVEHQTMFPPRAVSKKK